MCAGARKAAGDPLGPYGEVPEPETVIAAGELLALLKTLIVALRSPGAVGEKRTLRMQPPPAAVLTAVHPSPVFLKSEAACPTMATRRTSRTELEVSWTKKAW